MTLRRAGSLLLWAAAFALAVPGVLYAAPAVTGSTGAYLVLSGSMVPTFHPGDLVFVAEDDAPVVGDVVTYRAKGALVTHRVIEVLEDGRLRTKGDANDSPDPWPVDPDDVVGTYRFRIPWWGLLLQALRTKAGYALLVVVPGALIIGREFVRLYRELDAADRSRRAYDELFARLEGEERAGS